LPILMRSVVGILGLIQSSCVVGLSFKNGN
jgi:hypothetical protein